MSFQTTETAAKLMVQSSLASIPAMLLTGKTLKLQLHSLLILDFQTGIMADTVAFANVRWVNWEDFSIRPDNFGKAAEAVGPLA